MEKFQVPYVWISLIDDGEIPSLINALGESEILKARMNLIKQDHFHSLVPTIKGPYLANDRLERFCALLPENQNYLIGSMALAPITLNGTTIGSLNQADFSCTRFAPGIDTSLLEQLALKVSLCLSNVTIHEKLKYLAYHDPLTGLLNRRVMESILKREFQRAQRYASNLSVVFLDLDNFKGVNDRYGHQVGDQFLQHVADKLPQMLRNSDIVARFAGDEFVAILPETAAEKAAMLMDRIKSHFGKNPMVKNGDTIPIGISYGVASTKDKEAKNSSGLLELADKRLYQMKASRK